MSAPSRTTILRTASVLAGALVCYLAVGNLLHRVIVPAPPPDPATFPVPGDRFSSTAEGFSQEVTGLQDGWVALRLTIRPHADGPPLHFHQTFDEVFVVSSGTLSVQLEDSVRTLGPGETLTIPAGTPHRPFNETDQPVVLASDTPVMPQRFAACLVQLYPVLDAGGPSVPLQMSVLDPGCDTHLADAPAPVMVALRWGLGPLARLLGYTPYDPARSLHPPTHTASPLVAR